MSGFHIIEEATNKQYQELIKQEIKRAQWTFVDDLTTPESTIYKQKNFGFGHNIFQNNMVLSPLFSLCYPLVLGVANDLGLNVTSVLHAKTMLQTPDTDASLHNNPHVDWYQDHAVILYYVNDADGDTFLFNETTNDYPSREISSAGTFSIKERITPKQGKAIYFDGRNFHASSRPTKGVRIILNFDVIVEPINQTGSKNDR